MKFLSLIIFGILFFVKFSLEQDVTTFSESRINENDHRSTNLETEYNSGSQCIKGYFGENCQYKILESNSIAASDDTSFGIMYGEQVFGCGLEIFFVFSFFKTNSKKLSKKKQ